MDQNTFNKIVTETISNLDFKSAIYFILLVLIITLLVLKDILSAHTNKRGKIWPFPGILLIFQLIQLYIMIVLGGSISAKLTYFIFFFAPQLIVAFSFFSITSIIFALASKSLSTTTQFFIVLSFFIFSILTVFLNAPVVYERTIFKEKICFGFTCAITRIDITPTPTLLK
ncbi:MAG: hypothetical protein NTV98_05405 [Candidatus Roizmanbacteria bacterium]|nr:hypothetical protein [Candidatus Roizmanbacteria bacterium]